MHGLINKAIQSFVCDTYGAECWENVTHLAELGFTDFEAMLSYEEELTQQVMAALSLRLEKPQEEILEDIGTYLVSHPNVEALRRLLRFGGVDFVEFLHSLDDLPDRAKLAVADLRLPQLELREHARDRFSLTIVGSAIAFGCVMIGILRTMADDYGALVFLEYQGGNQGVEIIEITLIETAFAAGRSFELGSGAA